MTVQMRLDSQYFESMKSGKKKIEIRLNDEKRQKVRVEDIIEFSKMPELRDKISVEVTEIKISPAHEEMIEDTSLSDFGGMYRSKEQLLTRYIRYTQEEQMRYGLVVFRVRLLDRIRQE